MERTDDDVNVSEEPGESQNQREQSSGYLRIIEVCPIEREDLISAEFIEKPQEPKVIRMPIVEQKSDLFSTLRIAGIYEPNLLKPEYIHAYGKIFRFTARAAATIAGAAAAGLIMGLFTSATKLYSEMTPEQRARL